MISVCMATYNGEQYIERQLKSILCQLNETDEVIVSDDGSTDKTIQIIDDLNDRRIKILVNNKHDYTRNFENALLHAKGDIIFLSDQDDIWMGNKVKTTMDFFKKYDCDFTVSDACVVDKDLTTIYDSHFKQGNIRTGFIKNWISTGYIGACMAFKKELLNKALPIPGKSKYIAHDYWLACVSEMYYKTELIDIPLIQYVRHGDNTSPALGKSRLSVFERIFKRLYTLYFLVKRR